MKPTSSWWQHLTQLPWSHYWHDISTGIRTLFARGALLGSMTQADPGLARVLLTVLSSFAFLILLLGDWRLAIALSGGAGVMLWVYSHQTRRDFCPWQDWWSHWLTPSSRPWLWAAASGGTVSLLVYGMLSIWLESEQRWLAVGLIAEGSATLAIFCLLAWESLQRRRHLGKSLLEGHLSAIASLDPFQRLAGIRQVQTLVEHNQVQPEQMRLVLDYLRLALEREAVAVVREALLEALQSVPIVSPNLGRRPSAIDDLAKKAPPLL